MIAEQVIGVMNKVFVCLTLLNVLEARFASEKISEWFERPKNLFFRVLFFLLFVGGLQQQQHCDFFSGGEQ